MTDVDMSPRRIWFGLTIPGKKMMKIIVPEGGWRRGHPVRGDRLLNLYKEEPREAFMSVVQVLNSLPDQESQFGPAFRDIGKPLPLLSMHGAYGAILTDMRDFLKFRLR